MHIEKLLVTNFRVLKNVEISNLSMCNVIIGNNGSGKTSLLESIFMLSRGKSFRHHQPRHYVTHEEQQTTIFAQFPMTSIGVCKTVSGETKLRLNHANVLTQSELTRELPVVLLDPTQLDILDHGSSERRSLLDWLAFHLQPNFHKTWLNYQRALKQRNSILRQQESHIALTQAQKNQLTAWDAQLATLGMQIHKIREHIIQQWTPFFSEVCKQFLPHYPHISLRYTAGFDTELGLDTVLTQRMQKDRELGYTRVGVHRADMVIFTQSSKKAPKKSVQDMFSRGEKKLLIMAIKLSQLQLLTSLDKHALILLDDVNAELDHMAVQRLLEGLKGCNSQLFITSLTDDILPTVKEMWEDSQCLYIRDGVVQTSCPEQ